VETIDRRPPAGADPVGAQDPDVGDGEDDQAGAALREVAHADRGLAAGDDRLDVGVAEPAASRRLDEHVGQRLRRQRALDLGGAQRELEPLQVRGELEDTAVPGRRRVEDRVAAKEADVEDRDSRLVPRCVLPVDVDDQRLTVRHVLLLGWRTRTPVAY
jgi:hypothetical protein